MGIKECTCHDEQWVMDGSVESLYCTPETNRTLHVTYTGIKTKIRRCYLNISMCYIQTFHEGWFGFALSRNKELVPQRDIA